jgi:hypothetical protein
MAASGKSGASSRYAFGLLDYVILAYLISHIPITLCIDAQAVLPSWVYPAALRDLLAWYRVAFGDPLMVPHPPAWFTAIVYCEVGLQLPYFFFAIRGWLARDEAVRIPTIIYGAHVATTLVPILGTFAAPMPGVTDAQRAALVGIYAPYLLVPLLMCWRAARGPLFAVAGGKAAGKTA